MTSFSLCLATDNKIKDFAFFNKRAAVFHMKTAAFMLIIHKSKKYR